MYCMVRLQMRLTEENIPRGASHLNLCIELAGMRYIVHYSAAVCMAGIYLVWGWQIT